jgi:hypothetical protein
LGVISFGSEGDEKIRDHGTMLTPRYLTYVDGHDCRFIGKLVKKI